MTFEVTLFRLYVLRAMYLLIFLMVPQLSWVQILDPSKGWAAGDGWGFTVCMLGAFSVLCGLGLRYPLKMLPLLFWELLWKAIWMARIALPLWREGKVDEALMENSVAVGMAALLLLVIPWPYVISHYVRTPGDRWR